MASTIHTPDATLTSKLANWATNTLTCVLIDISTYSRTADTVLADLTQVAATGGYTAGGQTVTSCVVSTDTTNHKTTVVITPAVWTGSTTISATGAAIIDTTDGNRIICVDDFGGTIASPGGTYTVSAITLEYTGF